MLGPVPILMDQISLRTMDTYVSTVPNSKAASKVNRLLIALLPKGPDPKKLIYWLWFLTLIDVSVRGPSSTASIPVCIDELYKMVITNGARIPAIYIPIGPWLINEVVKEGY